MLNNINTSLSGSSGALRSELPLNSTGIKSENASFNEYLNLSQSELNVEFASAVKKHDVEKMQNLIEAGADLETPISYVWTDGDCDWNVETPAYTYAVREKAPKLLRVLVNAETNLNKALHLAAKHGFSDIVEELISKGANVNDLQEDNNTPLLEAIRYGSPSIVEKLINAGADVNYVNDNKETPLLNAVRYCGFKTIQILLQAGANVASVNKSGQTALMLAITYGDVSAVEVLIKHPQMFTGSFFGFGTKPINYADNKGNTALILAIKNVRYTYLAGRPREYEACMNSQRILEMLLAVPEIDFHHENQNGETAVTLLKELQKKAARYPG